MGFKRAIVIFLSFSFPIAGFTCSPGEWVCNGSTQICTPGQSLLTLGPGCSSIDVSLGFPTTGGVCPCYGGGCITNWSCSYIPR